MPLRRISVLIALPLLAALTACSGSNSNGSNNGSAPAPPASNNPFWSQWGANAQHTGGVAAAGQSANRILANLAYDPFVTQEKTENLPVFGAQVLTVHYQAPLIDGNDVYMIDESGSYISCSPTGAWLQGAPCGPNTWNTKIWGEARHTWVKGQLTEVWCFMSDWKPPVNGFGLFGWEPVFHPADANNFIYVPGAGGTVWKVQKTSGTAAAHIDPFAGVSIQPRNTYVSSPITADGNGNVYYNVIELADSSLGDPWVQNDVVGAWLVKITSSDQASIVSYAVLVPNAPPAISTNCPGTFFNLGDSGASLPWPPSNSAVSPTQLCGSQRPGVNIAPAVAPDGTIYTASLAHFDSMVAYLVAIHPDLTPKWTASLQNLLSDGCGFLVPIAPASNPNQPNSCRTDSVPGVDPTTNTRGSGSIIDQASSSPTVLPDGSVLFGAITNYANARGHLFKFDSAGNFLDAYNFGWDSTPGVYTHNGTYSILIKDNHYDAASYCFFNNPICQKPPPGPYFITQLDSNLNVQWQFKGTNTQSCVRNPDGSLKCMSDHPNGFEWCINMPAVDSNGNVYANSEDGNLYILPQGQSGVFTQPAGNLFLNLALGAAYTPLSIGPDGKLYTENNGQLFVVGN